MICVDWCSEFSGNQHNKNLPHCGIPVNLLSLMHRYDGVWLVSPFIINYPLCLIWLVYWMNKLKISGSRWFQRFSGVHFRSAGLQKATACQKGRSPASQYAPTEHVSVTAADQSLADDFADQYDGIGADASQCHGNALPASSAAVKTTTAVDPAGHEAPTERSCSVDTSHQILQGCANWFDDGQHRTTEGPTQSAVL